MTEKQKQRAQGRAARKDMTDEKRASANAALCARIAATEAFKQARTVLLYAAFDGEPDLSGLLPLAPEKCFVWPRCVTKTEFIALAPNGPEGWQIGAFGIREPDPAHARQLAPRQLDLILVPGTAFDRAGQRVGMGAGMYDRFLSQCPQAVTLGTCYECQLVDRVAAQPHDQPLTAVVTERGIYPASVQV